MAALISTLQRSRAPHILQTSKTLPPPSFSGSFFSPIQLTAVTLSRPAALLHAHAHVRCAAGSYWTGPRCLISASPSVCPHKQPHQSDHCSARGQSWTRGVLADLHRWANSRICCKFACLCRASSTNSQLHRCIVSAETEAGIFRCDRVHPSSQAQRSPIAHLASPAPTLHLCDWTKERRRKPDARHCSDTPSAIADTRQLQ